MFKAADIYWFSGTGNTLLTVRSMAAALSGAGVDVHLHRMEQTDPAGVVPGPDRLLGLACPVAAFSTFPLVWRFVEALPPGQGRPVFLLATMGGMAGLLAGPMHGLLTNKGYHPVGVRQIVMPDNYLRIRPAETCAKRQAKGRLQEMLLEAEEKTEAEMDTLRRQLKQQGLTPLQAHHQAWEMVRERYILIPPEN